MAESQKQGSAEKEIQKRVDEAEDKGFLGEEVDPTPNEEYSLQKPGSWKVPEADPKAAAEAAKASSRSRFGGEEA